MFLTKPPKKWKFKKTISKAETSVGRPCTATGVATTYNHLHQPLDPGLQDVIAKLTIVEETSWCRSGHVCHGRFPWVTIPIFPCFPKSKSQVEPRVHWHHRFAVRSPTPLICLEYIGYIGAKNEFSSDSLSKVAGIINHTRDHGVLCVQLDPQNSEDGPCLWRNIARECSMALFLKQGYT